MTGTHAHADLDALADALADDDGPPGDLTACPTCSAALEELRRALPLVAADLASLPPVPAAPPATALALPAAATTVVPLASRRRSRWLLPAGGVAAAAVLVTGGLLLTRGTDNGKGTAAKGAGADSAVSVSHTGSGYTKGSLGAAVPQLLKGVPERAAGVQAPSVTAAVRDPLATLETTSGLAACLAGLTAPGDESVPLAVDYASFEGKPALVVVLPSSRPSKLDVFVVGAACNQTEQDVLYYLHVDRPTG